MTTIPDPNVFEAERRRLLGLAYRMLGSMSDAEDVVQDAWVRWQAADPNGDELDRPAAWLTTVVTRLAIDRLRSARRQRESYVGPWLPEPVTGDPDPADSAEIAESLTLGFLTLLERLTPLERAVFLLADVFDEPYAQIAPVVGRSEPTCRQIASRARRRVREGRTGRVETAPATEPPDRAGRDRITSAFVAATLAGDVDGLLQILAPDVVLVSDGGAHRYAARRPVRGAERVARFVINVSRRLSRASDWTFASVNGEPGLIATIDGEPYLVTALEVSAGTITAIRVILNPSKLSHVIDA